MRRLPFYIALVVVALILIFLPHLLSEYRLNMVIRMLIYSLFAVSYNLLLGQGGLLSFGHAAYFGMGAYSNILMLKHWGLPLPLSIFLGGVAGALLGLLFGIFVVRMRGVPFALLTLAFNQLIYAVAEKWRTVTGGEDGIAAMRAAVGLPGIGRLDLFPTSNWYLFVLLVVALSLLGCWYFTQTPFGKVNLYMRENEERTKFLGYNTYLSRLLVYCISTFFAGLAGALASGFEEYVGTTFINLDKSTEVLMMTFIGGTGSFFGPVLGASFLIYVNDLLSTLTERWSLIQGVIFIILVMYMPEGLSGIYFQLKRMVPHRAAQWRKTA